MRESIKNKAIRLFKENKVKLLSINRNIILEVEGSEHKHLVIFGEKGCSCDCTYWTLTGKLCSHILAAIIFLEQNNIKIYHGLENSKQKGSFKSA